MPENIRAWTFRRDGVPETVELEQWAWEATYADGSKLRQFGDDGAFHQLAEIDRERVAFFSLYRTDGGGRIDLQTPGKARLVHKYRNYVLSAGTPAESRARVYVFGYDDAESCCRLFVLPTGRVIHSFKEDIPLQELLTTQ